MKVVEAGSRLCRDEESRESGVSVAPASTNSRRGRDWGRPQPPAGGTPSGPPVFLCHTRKHERATTDRGEGRGRHAGGMHVHDVGEREGRGPSHCPQGNLLQRIRSSKWWLSPILRERSRSTLSRAPRGLRSQRPNGLASPPSKVRAKRSMATTRPIWDRGCAATPGGGIRSVSAVRRHRSRRGQRMACPSQDRPRA